MKKITAILLAGMMALSLVGCGSTASSTTTAAATEAATEAATTTAAATEAATEAVKPETITIQALNGNKEMADIEVPYDPERIAILDMPALDVIDAIGVGDRIVGSAKVTIEYLTDYNPDDSDGKIANLGSVKTADLEQVAICEPDIIFIGGRLSASYDALSEIAPVVYLAVDYEKGVVQSTADNAKTIASIFGKEAEIDGMMAGFQTRIDALNTVLDGKDILLSMYNNNAMSIMDTESQLNILARELGGNNLGETVGEVDKATHGEDASWETIVSLNPEYIFVLDRSTATGAAEEGILGAREVIENDLIKELDVYKNGNIVYFIEHANVWYTSTGGIQALDTMLADLEEALLNGDSTVAAGEAPESVTIQALNGNKEMADIEVPYNPERIAILDMPALDIIDSLGLGDRIVGSAKVTIEYLTDYNPDDSEGKIANLGSVKTADLEQVAICEPDIIFIGGRLSASYDALSEIAPVVYLAVDYEKGVVNSTADNAKTIASIFGMEDEIDAKMSGFQARIDALKPVLEGKNILLSMYNNNAMSIMDTESQLNILARELGGNNLGETVGEVDKATHGEDASWETIVSLNPEYIFVLDRSTATGAADEGILGAQEVIENDLIKELDVYKNGNIVYFIQHANVWYTSTGGIQALDTMLADLEAALLQ